MQKHSRRDVMLVSSFLPLANSGLAATAAHVSSLAPLAPEVQAWFEKFCDEGKLAGAMLAVVKNGRLQAFHGHGKASVAFDAPVAPSTRFQIGSLGKQVTAVAVLKLFDQGKLSLDDAVGKHVSGLPGWMQPLPVRLLLGHLSGIADYEEGFEWDRPFPREALLKAVADPIGRPREVWVYSNSAYVILGWLIESVGGKSYAHYIEQDLFRPAEMPLACADAADTPVHGRAEPYHWVDGVLRHATRMEHMVSRSSDGGVLFTALDWAPWLAAIDGGLLVSPATLAAMYQPGRFASGRASDYGFGWFLDKVRGQDVWSHSGSVPGFVSLILRYPGHGLSVIFHANCEPLPGTSRLVLEDVIEHYAPGATFLTLSAGREPSLRRAKMLAAFLAGDLDNDAVAPEIVHADRIAKRPPGPRIKGRVTDIGLLEAYPVQGGSVSRYRVRTDETERTVKIGWTTDDQVYVYR